MDEDVRRLDRFLFDTFPDLPYPLLQKIIRRRWATVNGAAAPPDRPLARGDVVELRLPKGDPSRPAPNPAIGLQVVYEDSHLLAVNKPAGLPVHPGPGHRTGSLVNALLARYPEALDRLGKRNAYGLCHRLDMDTSGVILVALDFRSHTEMQRQFREREISKVYIALAGGRLKHTVGEIDLPLGEMATARKRSVPGRGDKLKRALTRYRVRERLPSSSLLEVFPLTGRMHQIRVHLAALGHPVLGDHEYGATRANALFRERYGLSRQFLHAYSIGFRHPITGERLTLTAPLSPDLTRVLEALRSEARDAGPGA